MASTHPRISVCVPAYNGARYLRECLDSILAQSYRDFDILIVDDGSTDDTVEIAQSYAARDSRVRLVVNPKNLGLVGNWNKCVSLATGEWIKFVFQDDAIAPACLSRMLDAAQPGVLLIACQRTIVFEDGTDPRARKWYSAHRKMVSDLFAGRTLVSAECCQNWALDRFGINVFGEPTAVMIHRSAFDNFGLFNPALVIACDLELWTRVSIQGGAAFIPEDLAMFRVHKDATSALVHAQRGFRMNILDNLVILHQYVFDRAYRPVRAAAARRSPPLALKTLFDKRRHEARARAEWAAHHPEHPDPSLMAEWTNVAKQYPRIAGHQPSHFAWRLRQRLIPSARVQPPTNAERFLR